MANIKSGTYYHIHAHIRKSHFMANIKSDRYSGTLSGTYYHIQSLIWLCWSHLDLSE